MVAPGIASLGVFLVRSWSDLEADFARYYEPGTPPLPEAVFGRNGISARRLRTLVEGLPLESRTARALGAPKPGDLTVADRVGFELAANVVDGISVSNYLFVKANVKRGTHVPEPGKVPRVWRETREDRRVKSTPEEIRSFFGDRLVVRYTPKEETGDARS